MPSSSLPWRLIVLMLNPSVFPDGMDLQLAGSFGDDFVNVHRPIAALRCDVLVHRIPGDALDIVTVFNNLFDTFSVTRSEDSCNIIGTSSKDVFPVGAPSEIVDLHRSASVGTS